MRVYRDAAALLTGIDELGLELDLSRDAAAGVSNSPKDARDGGDLRRLPSLKERT
jgi:hypothetical protein